MPRDGHPGRGKRTGTAGRVASSGAPAQARGRPTEMADRVDRSGSVAQQDFGPRRPRFTRDRRLPPRPRLAIEQGRARPTAGRARRSPRPRACPTCGRTDAARASAREGCSAIADQRRRVVVPAAAGSSPVAHPSRNPCKAGISTPDHEVPKSPRGQIRGQMRTQLPPGPRRMRSVMSPRYGSAGTSPSSTWCSTTSSSSRARATFAARRSRTSRTRARTPGSENSQDGTFCRAVHRRTEASCWSKASMAGSSQGASRR